jgi:hypothetical protein
MVAWVFVCGKVSYEARRHLTGSAGAHLGLMATPAAPLADPNRLRARISDGWDEGTTGQSRAAHPDARPSLAA